MICCIVKIFLKKYSHSCYNYSVMYVDFMDTLPYAVLLLVILLDSLNVEDVITVHTLI